MVLPAAELITPVPAVPIAIAKQLQALNMYSIDMEACHVYNGFPLLQESVFIRPDYLKHPDHLNYHQEHNSPWHSVKVILIRSLR
jgi:hypothetical protein